jgi:hypothetical protein
MILLLVTSMMPCYDSLVITNVRHVHIMQRSPRWGLEKPTLLAKPGRLLD